MWDGWADFGVSRRRMTSRISHCYPYFCARTCRWSICQARDYGFPFWARLALVLSSVMSGPNGLRSPFLVKRGQPHPLVCEPESDGVRHVFLALTPHFVSAAAVGKVVCNPGAIPYLVQPGGVGNAVTYPLSCAHAHRTVLHAKHRCTPSAVRVHPLTCAKKGRLERLAPVRTPLVVHFTQRALHTPPHFCAHGLTLWL